MTLESLFAVCVYTAHVVVIQINATKEFFQLLSLLHSGKGIRVSPEPTCEDYLLHNEALLY